MGLFDFLGGAYNTAASVVGGAASAVGGAISGAGSAISGGINYLGGAAGGAVSGGINYASGAINYAANTPGVVINQAGQVLSAGESFVRSGITYVQKAPGYYESLDGTRFFGETPSPSTHPEANTPISAPTQQALKLPALPGLPNLMTAAPSLAIGSAILGGSAFAAKLLNQSPTLIKQPTIAEQAQRLPSTLWGAPLALKNTLLSPIKPAQSVINNQGNLLAGFVAAGNQTIQKVPLLKDINSFGARTQQNPIVRSVESGVLGLPQTAIKTGVGVVTTPGRVIDTVMRRGPSGTMSDVSASLNAFKMPNPIQAASAIKTAATKNPVAAAGLAAAAGPVAVPLLATSAVVNFALNDPIMPWNKSKATTTPKTGGKYATGGADYTKNAVIPLSEAKPETRDVAGEDILGKAKSAQSDKAKEYLDSMAGAFNGLTMEGDPTKIKVEKGYRIETYHTEAELLDMLKKPGLTTSQKNKIEGELDQIYFNQQRDASELHHQTRKNDVWTPWNPYEAKADRAHIKSEIVHQDTAGGTPNLKFWEYAQNPIYTASAEGGDPYLANAINNAKNNPIYAKFTVLPDKMPEKDTSVSTLIQRLNAPSGNPALLGTKNPYAEGLKTLPIESRTLNLSGGVIPTSVGKSNSAVKTALGGALIPLGTSVTTGGKGDLSAQSNTLEAKKQQLLDRGYSQEYVDFVTKPGISPLNPFDTATAIKVGAQEMWKSVSIPYLKKSTSEQLDPTAKIQAYDNAFAAAKAAGKVNAAGDFTGTQAEYDDLKTKYAAAMGAKKAYNVAYAHEQEVGLEGQQKGATRGLPSFEDIHYGLYSGVLAKLPGSTNIGGRALTRQEYSTFVKQKSEKEYNQGPAGAALHSGLNVAGGGFDWIKSHPVDTAVLLATIPAFEFAGAKLAGVTAKTAQGAGIVSRVPGATSVARYLNTPVLRNIPLVSKAGITSRGGAIANVAMGGLGAMWVKGGVEDISGKNINLLAPITRQPLITTREKVSGIEASKRAGAFGAQAWLLTAGAYGWANRAKVADLVKVKSENLAVGTRRAGSGIKESVRSSYQNNRNEFKNNDFTTVMKWKANDFRTAVVDAVSRVTGDRLTGSRTVASKPRTMDAQYTVVSESKATGSAGTSRGFTYEVPQLPDLTIKTGTKTKAPTGRPPSTTRSNVPQLPDFTGRSAAPKVAEVRPSGFDTLMKMPETTPKSSGVRGEVYTNPSNVIPVRVREVLPTAKKAPAAAKSTAGPASTPKAGADSVSAIKAEIRWAEARKANMADPTSIFMEDMKIKALKVKLKQAQGFGVTPGTELAVVPNNANMWMVPKAKPMTWTTTDQVITNTLRGKMKGTKIDTFKGTGTRSTTAKVDTHFDPAKLQGEAAGIAPQEEALRRSFELKHYQWDPLTGQMRVSTDQIVGHIQPDALGQKLAARTAVAKPIDKTGYKKTSRTTNVAEEESGIVRKSVTRTEEWLNLNMPTPPRVSVNIPKLNLKAADLSGALTKGIANKNVYGKKPFPVRDAVQTGVQRMPDVPREGIVGKKTSTTVEADLTFVNEKNKFSSELDRAARDFLSQPFEINPDAYATVTKADIKLGKTASTDLVPTGMKGSNGWEGTDMAADGVIRTANKKPLSKEQFAELQKWGYTDAGNGVYMPPKPAASPVSANTGKKPGYVSRKKQTFDIGKVFDAGEPVVKAKTGGATAVKSAAPEPVLQRQVAATPKAAPKRTFMEPPMGGGRQQLILEHPKVKAAKKPEPIAAERVSNDVQKILDQFAAKPKVAKIGKKAVERAGYQKGKLEAKNFADVNPIIQLEQSQVAIIKAGKARQAGDVYMTGYYKGLARHLAKSGAPAQTTVAERVLQGSLAPGDKNLSKEEIRTALARYSDINLMKIVEGSREAALRSMDPDMRKVSLTVASEAERLLASKRSRFEPISTTNPKKTTMTRSQVRPKQVVVSRPKQAPVSKLGQMPSISQIEKVISGTAVDTRLSTTTKTSEMTKLKTNPESLFKRMPQTVPAVKTMPELRVTKDVEIRPIVRVIPDITTIPTVEPLPDLYQPPPPPPPETPQPPPPEEPKPVTPEVPPVVPPTGGGSSDGGGAPPRYDRGHFAYLEITGIASPGQVIAQGIKGIKKVAKKGPLPIKTIPGTTPGKFNPPKVPTFKVPKLNLETNTGSKVKTGSNKVPNDKFGSDLAKIAGRAPTEPVSYTVKKPRTR